MSLYSIDTNYSKINKPASAAISSSGGGVEGSSSSSKFTIKCKTKY
jgi:hypothetical protein